MSAEVAVDRCTLYPVTEADKLRHVLTLNKDRRHLSASQLACRAVELLPALEREKEQERREKIGNSRAGETVANVPPHGGRKHPYEKFIQLDTTDVLFVCGGAFEGLDDIIGKRVGRSTLGFKSPAGRHKVEGDRERVLEQVVSDDLLEYGLIPEFVGRLPVVVSVHPLDEEMLVQILTQPKNAIVRQFQRLFALDGVELVFTEDALRETAREALQCRMGARGLRSIIEETLLEIMYQIPSREDVKQVVIDADTIRQRRHTQPLEGWDEMRTA